MAGQVTAKPPVLVVLGPTASGKSLLAMAIARRLASEIISVDAMKVYRHLDVGTAKPSARDRAEVPHHGLDLIDPSETFSVAQFLDYAGPLLAQVHQRGRLPILDVTAPLYLKALMYGIQGGPSPDPELRARLEATPGDALYDELGRRDPQRARQLHPNDVKRIVRALEHVMLKGKPMSELSPWAEARDDVQWVLTGIAWPREMLYGRVLERVDRMMAAGWLDEVRNVRERWGFSRTAAEAHGYKRLLAHLRGELSMAQAIEMTRKDVKTYARKSMTFFRQFPRVQWLQVSSEEEMQRAALYLSGEMREALIASGVLNQERDPD